jgi:Mn-dependent DtxR family transcriptional regulator
MEKEKNPVSAKERQRARRERSRILNKHNIIRTFFKEVMGGKKQRIQRE